MYIRSSNEGILPPQRKQNNSLAFSADVRYRSGVYEPCDGRTEKEENGSGTSAAPEECKGGARILRALAGRPHSSARTSEVAQARHFYIRYNVDL